MFGKLIGGLLGYMAAGFFGGFIGILIGHFFDRGAGQALRFDYGAERSRLQQLFFETSFSLSSQQASELFSSAAHLLAAPQLLDNQLSNLVEKNEKSFSPEQAESMIDMVVTVARASGDITAAQRELVDKMRSTFATPRAQEGTWQ